MPAPTTKERLTEAAFALFAERGFEQTTVDDIAERAGVGRTTFFRTFGSKEQVVFPDHERILTAIRERLSTSTPETAVIAVSEAARLVLHHYLAEGERARRRYALTKSVPALRDRERAGIQQYERVFQEFIHRWMGSEPGTALRAALMANAVVTAHNHVLRHWLRGETDAPDADFDDAMGELGGLFGPDSRPGGDAGGTAVVLLRTDAALDQLRPRVERLLEGLGRPEHTRQPLGQG
jgi:AcrR family transcriptional regulator